jgi:hypothetical protein
LRKREREIENEFQSERDIEKARESKKIIKDM